MLTKVGVTTALLELDGDFELEKLSNALIRWDIKDETADFFETGLSGSSGRPELIYAGPPLRKRAVTESEECVSMVGRRGIGLEVKEVVSGFVFTTSESENSLEIPPFRGLLIVGAGGASFSDCGRFLEPSLDRLVSIRRGEVGEKGVVGVLESEIDLASSTVALCSSSSSDSSDREGGLEYSSCLAGVSGGGFCFLSSVDSEAC